MRLGRFLVEAVVVSGASPTELARTHGISRSWLFKLLVRYRAGGYEAVEPRSRRPASSPTRTPPDVVERVLRLRAELVEAGLDAGPQSIVSYLEMGYGSSPSKATVWRILKANGLVTPQPQKRPRSSWIRFQAELPNEMAGRRHPLAAG